MPLPPYQLSGGSILGPTRVTKPGPPLPPAPCLSLKRQCPASTSPATLRCPRLTCGRPTARWGNGAARYWGHGHPQISDQPQISDDGTAPAAQTGDPPAIFPTVPAGKAALVGRG